MIPQTLKKTSIRYVIYECDIWAFFGLRDAGIFHCMDWHFISGLYWKVQIFLTITSPMFDFSDIILMLKWWSVLTRCFTFSTFFISFHCYWMAGSFFILTDACFFLKISCCSDAETSLYASCNNLKVCLTVFFRFTINLVFTRGSIFSRSTVWEN